ncbi:MAG: hypothetical protein HY873_03345 [Chloroflexi bacterium]|nr:hypothetical protein [Chloroflexota bacterium]
MRRNLVRLVGGMALLAGVGLAMLQAQPASGGASLLQSGDLVVATGSNSIARVPAAGGTPEVLVSGGSLSSIEDVAIDGAGNLIAADIGSNKIFRVSCTDLSVTEVATITGTESSNVHDVAVDGGGDYIVLTNFDSALFRVTPAGAVSMIVDVDVTTNADELEGLDIDGSGNIVVADEFPSNPGIAYRVSSNGSSITPLGNGDLVNNDGLEAVIVDADTSFVIVDEVTPALLRLTNDGVTLTTIYSGSPLDEPQGVARASNGDYFVSNESFPGSIVRVAGNGSSASVFSSGTELGNGRDVAVYTSCGAPGGATATSGPAKTHTPTPAATSAPVTATPIPPTTAPPPPTAPSAGNLGAIQAPDTGTGGKGASAGAPSPWIGLALALGGATLLAGSFVHARTRSNPESLD